MTHAHDRYLPVTVSAPRARGACDDARRETAGTFREPDSRRRPAAGAGAAFEAHMAGQAHPRRGLKGGEATLRTARAAYLTTQWTGPDDRRPPSGLLRRVVV